ncbi:MAG TPA: class I SAM-dependent methyltransferase [Acidimicrobiales bacterium]|nr:class I SAM-dependent methyltransferase [Acidimicrobiales bacterium]
MSGVGEATGATGAASATGAADPPALDDAYFDVMATQAQVHWWYRARRALVAQMLDGALPPEARVVDVGCGTGDNLGALEAAAGGTVVGVELSPYAVRHAPRSPAGDVRVGVARAEQLPFAAGCADLVTSMDVIEHLDDVAALAEYRRVLRPGGWLLLTVPAYPWLWSAHDDWAAHLRRYTRPSLVGAVRAAGFRPERSTYFNSFLVPPAALLRRTPVRRLVKVQQDEVGAANPVVDRVMTGLAGLERRWTRRHRVPFGLSIACLARRD